jgi:hypothetical protein
MKFLYTASLGFLINEFSTALHLPSFFTGYLLEFYN